MPDHISVRGARLHNLKNVDLDIPRNRLVVLTGVSGSGKSTLGFDILNMEGARQYLESLGFVAFGVSRPPVDSIAGLSPTISIDQHQSNHSPRSTVGTTTDVYTYLRILYARLGHRPCPHCGRTMPPGLDLTDKTWEDDTALGDDPAASAETFPCPHCGAPVPEIGMAFFSFNKPEGACPACTGLGFVHQANLDRLADASLSIAGGAIHDWNAVQIDYYGETLQKAAEHYGFQFDMDKPLGAYTPAERDLLFHGVESAQFRRHFPGIEPPGTVRQGRFEGVATGLLRRYAEHIGNPEYRRKIDDYLVIHTCPACEGTRLRPESRAVTVNGRTLIDLSRLSLEDLGRWLERLPVALGPQEMIIAAPILSDLGGRIERLLEVGAGYLTMERDSPTLSVGEAQRLRLASLLGSGLTGVLYVFDEPTVGLHQRDTERLIRVLRRLRDLENAILVIEHDMEIIRAADVVIDFGPGAGKHGGRVVAVGSPEEVARQPGSITGDYLAGRVIFPAPPRRPPGERALTIHGAREHNLQSITARLPLGLLVAVTGVSGSGKSSLIFDTLDRAGRQRLYRAAEAPGAHDAIEGWEHIEKIVTIDQQPLGRVSRSNAATYTDVFTPIRQAFAAQPEATRRGFTARRFSFNVPGGRCERCEGAGVLLVNMHFLPDVAVRCPTCRGRRFNAETLAVTYREHDINQVLGLTVEEALALFADVPAAATRLRVLADVGLGYLQLGQPASTLSGGEAQRVKLARELGRRAAGHTLYLLDEPTIGLHPADTARLLVVLQRLVDAGNSVIVVEHNLDVIRAADWLLDLGPEGGAAGGRLIAEGPPEEVARSEASHTGRYLRELST